MKKKSLLYLSDVNECELYKPCMNGARCIDMYGTYRCECKVGWMGKNCDIGKPQLHVRNIK